MRTIGVLGAGSLGAIGARLAVPADLDGWAENSRDAETNARADLVDGSMPIGSITDLPTAELAGKPALNTGNYYPDPVDE